MRRWCRRSGTFHPGGVVGTVTVRWNSQDSSRPPPGSIPANPSTPIPRSSKGKVRKESKNDLLELLMVDPDRNGSALWGGEPAFHSSELTVQYSCTVGGLWRGPSCGKMFVCIAVGGFCPTSYLYKRIGIHTLEALRMLHNFCRGRHNSEKKQRREDKSRETARSRL